MTENEQVIKKNSGVYAIENLQNGKFYIGSTKTFDIRYSAHFRNMKLGKHPNQYLQNSADKYGIANFRFSVLEFAMEEKLLEVEQKWLDVFLG